MKPRRERTDTRKPPFEAIRKLHRPEADGKCQWCGEATSDLTPMTKKPRRWHAACEDEFAQIVNAARMRGAVFARDKGICAYCGEDWSQRVRFQKGSGCIHAQFDLRGKSLEQYRVDRGLGFYHSTEVVWVSLWHVEHTTPLWKVAHLPPIERIEFFKLAAVKTACTPCHKVKSAKEAAEKAHHDRLEKKRLEKAEAKPDQLQPPPAKKQGRKLQSRGFDRVYRPMRSRK